MKTTLFNIRDLKALHQEFYGSYNADYWRCEIQLLKNCHDNFDSIKPVLLKGLDVSDTDYKRVLRTELHFLYFQMVEALFSLLFSVTDFLNDQAWLALTFSNDRSTGFYSDIYQKIRSVSKGTHSLLRNVPVKGGGKTIEIPLLHWAFYFVHKINMPEAQWQKNLSNINGLLKAFAHDFSDRSEYNAYKHAMRFFNTKFYLAMQNEKTKAVSVLGNSEDSIVYLEPETNKDLNGNMVKTGSVLRVAKPFNFERDYRCCVIISDLIGNIIDSRKARFTDKHKGTAPALITYADIDVKQIVAPNLQTTRFSSTV